MLLLVEKFSLLAGTVAGVRFILQHKGLVLQQGECASAVCERSEARLPRLCGVFQPAHTGSRCFTESRRGIPHWL